MRPPQNTREPEPSGAGKVEFRRRKFGSAVVILGAHLSLWSVGVDRIACWLLPGAVLVLVPLWLPGSLRALHLRFSLAFVATCFTVLLVDCGLRAVYAERLYYRRYERLVHCWPPDSMQTRRRPDADIEIEALGDLAAMTWEPSHRERRRVRFRTGPRVFRNGQPPARPIDLILLGDSFMMGCGTTESETLQSELRRVGDYSIFNLAILGGPWEQFMILKSELRRLDLAAGATVLWGLFAGNDLDETCRSRLERASARLLERLRVRYATFRNRSALRQMTRARRAPASDQVAIARLPNGQPVLFYREHVTRSRRTGADVEGHRNRAGVKAVIDELLRFVSERELHVKVFTIPSKPQVYSWLLESSPPIGDAFSVMIGGWCATAKVRFLALSPHSDGVARERLATSGEMFWWRDDSHWNGVGNRFAVNIVHSRLLNR